MATILVIIVITVIFCVQKMKFMLKFFFVEQILGFLLKFQRRALYWYIEKSLPVSSLLGSRRMWILVLLVLSDYNQFWKQDFGYKVCCSFPFSRESIDPLLLRELCCAHSLRCRIKWNSRVVNWVNCVIWGSFNDQYEQSKNKFRKSLPGLA